jgi:predicted O-methyltransferase YrrM
MRRSIALEYGLVEQLERLLGVSAVVRHLDPPARQQLALIAGAVRLRNARQAEAGLARLRFGCTLAKLGDDVPLSSALPALREAPEALAWLGQISVRRRRWAHLAQVRAFELVHTPGDLAAQRVRLARALDLAGPALSLHAVLEILSSDGASLTWLDRWLTERGRFDQLAELRALALHQAAEKRPARLRLLGALQRARSDRPIGPVLAQIESDAPQLVWLATILGRLERFAQLAELRALQVRLQPERFRVRLRLIEAQYLAGQEEPKRQAYAEAVAAAQQPALLSELAKVARAQRDWSALSTIRCAQVAAAPHRFERVAQHLRLLRKEAPAAAGAFLEQVARLAWPDPQAHRALRRLLAREAAWPALRQVLTDCLAAQPERADLMLDLAGVHAALGDEGAAHALRARAHVQLLDSDAGGAGEVVIRCELQRMETAAWTSTWTSTFRAGALRFAPAKLGPLIEHVAALAQGRGAFEIWSGYGRADLKNPVRVRTFHEIRVPRRLGEFLAWLARTRRPRLIVEIGTGFGVSGMYWAAGLEESGQGSLLTCEPNGTWQRIAAGNLAQISARVRSVQATFEETAATVAAHSIDVLFVDAIHTPEAVRRQLELARPLLRPGALVLIDDIRFSAALYEYWLASTRAGEVRAALEIEGRLGLLEMR